jgi:hypothetical protein
LACCIAAGFGVGFGISRAGHFFEVKRLQEHFAQEQFVMKQRMMAIQVALQRNETEYSFSVATPPHAR